MCFSAKHGSSPPYLSDLLHATLRLVHNALLLKIKQYKRKIHGFRTFSCFGLHIWNSVPQDLRQ